MWWYFKQFSESNREGYIMKTKIYYFIIGIAAILCCFGLSDFSCDGTITGTVSTSSGVGIQGATITTGTQSFSATTDANGDYEITGLPEGIYNLTASSDGYKTSDTVEVTIVRKLPLFGAEKIQDFTLEDYIGETVIDAFSIFKEGVENNKNGLNYILTTNFSHSAEMGILYNDNNSDGIIDNTTIPVTLLNAMNRNDFIANQFYISISSTTKNENGSNATLGVKVISTSNLLSTLTLQYESINTGWKISNWHILGWE